MEKYVILISKSDEMGDYNVIYKNHLFDTLNEAREVLESLWENQIKETKEEYGVNIQEIWEKDPLESDWSVSKTDDYFVYYELDDYYNTLRSAQIIVLK